MSTQTEPEIILYDLACTKNICFSPTVWKIRLILNYKKILYKTVFLEFPDIEPTLKELGLSPGKSATGTPSKYTVPSIHHLPTNTYMMDSIPIASFLESTYPSPPLAQTSSHGQEIESRVRAVLAKPTYLSIVPREILILSPRSAAYFRRTREAALGHSLEDLMGAHAEKEDKMYEGIKEDMEQLSQLMMANKEQGPFVLGAEPSLTDFFIAGALQSARTVDEGVWRRSVAFEGFRRVYEGCEGWMERRD